MCIYIGNLLRLVLLRLVIFLLWGIVSVVSGLLRDRDLLGVVVGVVVVVVVVVAAAGDVDSLSGIVQGHCIAGCRG